MLFPRPSRDLPPWLTAVALLAAAPAGADSPDPAHGRELHDRHCIDCHADIMGGDPRAIYRRPDRRIGSMLDLYEQVGRCRNSYGEPWPQDWVEDVATWLDGRFYHFDPFDPAGDRAEESEPE